VIGVNTFINPEADQAFMQGCVDLARSTEEEKDSQLKRLKAFHKKHAKQAPAALDRLQKVAQNRGNIFEELMTAVRHCSLGQISRALYEVGGRYRRGM
jgi:methylmalonyl-CoA mutase